MLFEVEGAGQLLGVNEDSVGVARRLLTLAQQHRAETHRQVLTRHLVHFLVGRHQLQVVKKLPQSHLIYTHMQTHTDRHTSAQTQTNKACYYHD